MALQTSIYNCAQLTDTIRELGFLPLLDGRIKGFSADAMVDEECRYVTFPDGGWDWPMWKWKGSVITEGECVYGKFFAGKAGFISREWWPDFCNYRRSRSTVPDAGSVEEGILTILQAHDSLTTRDLRALCGFTGPRCEACSTATLPIYGFSNFSRRFFVSEVATMSYDWRTSSRILQSGTSWLKQTLIQFRGLKL